VLQSHFSLGNAEVGKEYEAQLLCGCCRRTGGACDYGSGKPEERAPNATNSFGRQQNCRGVFGFSKDQAVEGEGNHQPKDLKAFKDGKADSKKINVRGKRLEEK
jgi:hypothetical protein